MSLSALSSSSSSASKSGAAVKALEKEITDCERTISTTKCEQTKAKEKAALAKLQADLQVEESQTGTIYDSSSPASSATSAASRTASYSHKPRRLLDVFA